MDGFYDEDNVLNVVVNGLKSVTDVIDDLQQRGYDASFTLSDNKWKCINNGEVYESKDVRVDRIYRFEDDSGVLNRFFLYTVRENRRGVRGILIIDINRNDHCYCIGHKI